LDGYTDAEGYLLACDLLRQAPPVRQRPIPEVGPRRFLRPAVITASPIKHVWLICDHHTIPGRENDDGRLAEVGGEELLAGDGVQHDGSIRISRVLLNFPNPTLWSRSRRGIALHC